MTSYELNVVLRPGDQFEYHVGGALYTDTVENVRYSSGSLAVYRQLNRRQAMMRRVTPRRWRKSLLIRPAEPASVIINGDLQLSGMTMKELENIKGAFRPSAS